MAPGNISSAEWKNQPHQNGTRKCPHCGGTVKNTFSGMISIGILVLCLGLALLGREYAPSIPFFIYGVFAGTAMIVFSLRLIKAQPSQ